MHPSIPSILCSPLFLFPNAILNHLARRSPTGSTPLPWQKSHTRVASSARSRRCTKPDPLTICLTHPQLCSLEMAAGSSWSMTQPGWAWRARGVITLRTAPAGTRLVLRCLVGCVSSRTRCPYRPRPGTQSRRHKSARSLACVILGGLEGGVGERAPKPQRPALSARLVAICCRSLAV